MLRIPGKILIDDRDKEFVTMFTHRMMQYGEKVITASSGKEMLEIIENVAIDVVILDINKLDGDDLVTLTQIKIMRPIVEVILLAGHLSTGTALQGMKLGAFDSLMKPADFNDIKLMLKKARNRKDEQEERIRQAKERFFAQKNKQENCLQQAEERFFTQESGEI